MEKETIEKYKNKPAEWFLNVINVCQCLQRGIASFPFRFEHFSWPYPDHIPHLSIERILDIGVNELDECGYFFENHCLQCKQPEVVCIHEKDYLNNLLRYKQLKRCMKKKTDDDNRR